MAYFLLSVSIMNKNPTCPRRKAEEVVKNGKIKEKQRFKCKKCSFQFTRLTHRGRPASEKALAVQLYALGLSMRAIGKLLKVSTTAVLKWIRNFAKANYEKPAPDKAILVELDEMWHYIKQKKTNYGYGRLIEEKLMSLLTGNAGGVTKKPS